MTDKEILEKAIQQAVDNGFRAGADDFKVDGLLIEWEVAIGIKITLGYEQLIYMHTFAKALWGKTEICSVCKRHHDTYSDCDFDMGNDLFIWQYHLQQMVIADNPIKYLGENI